MFSIFSRILYFAAMGAIASSTSPATSPHCLSGQPDLGSVPGVSVINLFPCNFCFSKISPWQVLFLSSRIFEGKVRSPDLSGKVPHLGKLHYFLRGEPVKGLPMAKTRF
jgi:hypothetical protein